MLAFRIAAMAAVSLWCGEARATVDWCGLAAAAPSSSMTFEQSAAVLGGLGCQAQPQDSAHMLSWSCSDRQSGDTRVLLYRSTEGYSAPTLLVIANQHMETLDNFRPCSSSGSPLTIRRAPDSGSALESRRGFQAGSIVVRDQASIRGRSYSTASLTLLRLGGRAFAVAAYPDHSLSEPAIGIAEAAFFGVKRTAYPSTRVEVAGKNIVTSPASEIITALQNRGAKLIRNDPESNLVTAVTLGPPVGLAGVREVEVSSVNDHAYQIVYKINTEADYLTFVRLLDERYGQSHLQNSSAMRGCRVRHWKSGHVGLLGALCEDRGYELRFINNVVSTQLSAYRDHASRSQQQPANRPRIDPDNL